MSTKSFTFTSESVCDGHPDKLADRISDSILDAILEQDPLGRVACETLVTTGMVLVSGEISTKAIVDIPSVVREAVKDIGYDDPSMGFDWQTCAVLTTIDQQASDIAQGVDSDKGKHLEQGAGDQGIMFGYATDETKEYLSMPIVLAHRITRRLAEARKDGTLPYLRPDGKSQVTVEYLNDEVHRVSAVVVAAQHKDGVEYDQLRADIMEKVIRHSIPAELLDENTKYFINETGRFVQGGPHADTGLTGRKIIVDTYGGVGSHGGGAFSGKDPSKVDRSGSYYARYIAKNIVAAGLAKRCELQVAYAIGVAEPVSLYLETFNTNIIPEDDILALINKHFDLRPAAMIDKLGLRRPIYKKTAAFGHFGKDDPDLSWEKTDIADIIRKDAGLE